MERSNNGLKSFKTILDLEEYKMAPDNFQNDHSKADGEQRLLEKNMKKRISLPKICWQEKQFDSTALPPMREASKDFYQLGYLPQIETGTPVKKKECIARAPTPIARSNSNASVLHHTNGFDMLSIDEEINNSRKIEEKRSKDRFIYSWLKGCGQTMIKSSPTEIERSPSVRRKLLQNRNEYSKQSNLNERTNETVQSETQKMQNLGSIKRTYANKRPNLRKHFSDSLIDLRLNIIPEINERPATSDGNEIQKQFLKRT